MIEPIREYLKNIKEFGIDPLRGGLKLDHADKLCRMVDVLLEITCETEFKTGENCLQSFGKWRCERCKAFIKCREIVEGK